MRNLFWPFDSDPEPGFVSRLGRLLHWIATAVAALFAWAGVGTAFSSDVESGAGFFAAGAFVFFIGRFVRWLFSGD